MGHKGIWALTAMAMLAAIYALAIPGRWPMFPWVYGITYFLFGVVLLGTVARWWTRGSPALWRPFMLSVGSLCAALEIGLRNAADTAPSAVDRWMVALLGLLVAAIAARWVPDRVTRLWFGVDRRVHDPGA